MSEFDSQEIFDGSSVPQERYQARAGWVKGIFVEFSSLEVPTDLLLRMDTRAVNTHTKLHVAE